MSLPAWRYGQRTVCVRAHMRVFYRFGEAGRSVTNPVDFTRPPRVRRFYPNFFSLDFVPIEGLEATAEYWVPESHALAGRLTLSNRTASVRKIDFDLCGALTPLDGKSLAFSQVHMVNVLAGRTAGLEPVLFMTGAPKPGSGPHPSLAIRVDLEPGQTKSLVWCVGAEDFHGSLLSTGAPYRRAAMGRGTCQDRAGGRGRYA